jgi:hypothetical protein
MGWVRRLARYVMALIVIASFALVFANDCQAGCGPLGFARRQARREARREARAAVAVRVDAGYVAYRRAPRRFARNCE